MTSNLKADVASASGWSGRVVVVTGATSGLGKYLAAAWARVGAKVALVARSPEPLANLERQLCAAGHVAWACPTDITQAVEVAALTDRTLARFGRVDALINNAGRSARQAIAQTTADDFSSLMELNFLAVVRCTQAFLPHLLAQRGHVVNIGSLAAKAASRYVGAYPASKFALAAYSQQLRLELGPQGLHVLLVCPGPIARDEGETSTVARAAETAAELPAAASQPGGGARLRLLDPARLAEEILRACARRAPELVRPRSARLLFAVQQLWPRLGDWIVLRKTR